ncbi:MAG: T9SS type A sorting domain-containing protein [Calditrichae bacterium]|nr:T9SS type A sorting domain-containing protein [Calditrichia bacterium]
MLVRLCKLLLPIRRFTFTATDPGNLSDSDAATFTVNSENDPPVVINIPDQTIEEGGNFTTINLDDYVSDADNSDDQISWTHSGNADLIVTITNRVATIMIPDINWNGYETITFTATDPGELADSDTARFTVTAVNDAPVVIALPALSFKEDESLISAKTDWYDFVDDKDNPDSLLIYTLADGKSVTAAVNGNNFVLSSPQDWFGMDTLKFKVTDGELSDSGLVIITVQPVNDAPQLIDMPQTVMIDDTSSFVLNVNDFVIDVDTPENKLTWQFSANNDSLLLDFDDTTSILKISALAIDKDVQVIITVTDDSSASASDTVTVQVNLVSALDELLSMIPVKYTLEQNYPNPFNPTTKIRFGLPKAGDVKIEIYNTGGQRVATLVNGFKTAGFHAISFDASGLASGLYFYRIQAKSFVQVKKMILMK